MLICFYDAHCSSMLTQTCVECGVQNQLAEYKEKVARLKEEVIKYRTESQVRFAKTSAGPSICLMIALVWSRAGVRRKTP